MANDIGISIYFRDSRLRIFNNAIRKMSNPEYIHLLVDEQGRLLYLQSCERDLDAFRVYSSAQEEERYHINAKNLMKYLASVIGVTPDSVSLRFEGEMLPDGQTICIDLTNYQEIAYEGIR